jgi:uncharacterized membrane protein
VVLLSGVMVMALVTGQPIRAAVSRVDAATFAQQVRVAPEVRGWERVALVGCMVFNVFGQAYDGATTVRALGMEGYREKNLLMRPLFDSPGKILGVKAAVAVGTTAIYWNTAERHPRITAAAACATGAVGTWAGWQNRRQMREAR